MPRSARPTGRRRWSGSRSARADRWRPGRCWCACDAAAVNFPDVLLIAERVPDQRAAAVRTGQRVRRRDRRDRSRGNGFRGRRPGDRNRSVRRLRRAGRGARGRAEPDTRRRRRPHRGGVRRRAPHGVSHAAVDGARRPPATRWSCSARAAASAWRPSNSASRSAPASRRWRRRPKSWTSAAGYGAAESDQPPATATCAPRCATRCPTAPTPSSTRSAASCPNPHCGRCAAAAASSPSATPRASSPAFR